jgi:anaerobic magnesium-protoporphyrin IX monomethyl ester cyclase
MRVLFVQPGSKEITNQYPPVGVLYLASAASNRGYEVDVYDAAAEGRSLDGAYEFAVDFQPDVLCLSLYTIGLVQQYTFLKRVRNTFPGSTVIVGGPHATALPSYTMRECGEIDFLVFGEGERTIVELLGHLERKEEIDHIKGICFRKNGEIVQNKARELIENLDEMPFPAYALLKNNGFTYARRSFNATDKVGAIISSRGCPFNCVFCFKATFGSKLRRRSAKNVVAEMAWQMKEFGVEEFQFLDDLFAVNSKWLNEFFDELDKQNIRVPWKCLARVTSVSKDDLLKMRGHGCYGVEFGVESGNDEVLKDANKGITAEQARKAFQAAKGVGLVTFGFFIFGLRKDTHETIRQTLHLAKKISPDACGFATLLPFPGSKVNSYLPSELKYEWQKFNSYYDKKALPFSICSVSPKDLREYSSQADSEVNGSLSYFFKNVLFRKRGVPSHRKEAFDRWYGAIKTLIKRGVKGQRAFVEGDAKNFALLLENSAVLSVVFLLLVLPYGLCEFFTKSARRTRGGFK